MSALSPAPAPTSGVCWTDLPTPLDSALPSCCLSYKQSALLPPLCFQLLADSFAFPNRVKPFKIKQIQTLLTNTRGGGTSALCPLCPLCSELRALCVAPSPVAAR